MEFLDFISLVPTNTFIAIANLIVLYFILKKLLFKPVTKMLQAREDEVNSMYEVAENAKAEAERVQQEYDGKIALADQEVDRLLTDGRMRAAELEREATEAAKAQASHILTKAEQDAQLLQKQAVKELQSELSDMAVELAAKVTEKEINAADHEALINDFLVSVKGERHE